MRAIPLVACLFACVGGESAAPSPTDTARDSATDSGGDTGTGCPTDRLIPVVVTGAAATDPNQEVGIFESSSFRMGDAAPLTRSLNQGNGSWILCLESDPPAVHLYEKAFFAAWIDLDGDRALDAGAEALCDRVSGGALAEELYFEGGVWRLGLRGAPGAALTPAAPLDGDACTR
ncbi:hypothetical protein LBMAG42_46110 [Deltaproteobacteria bacterium]|nr:hypothetical protein LBMAG42_46110 [Deltaproteobacteria bacterium]